MMQLMMPVRISAHAAAALMSVGSVRTEMVKPIGDQYEVMLSEETIERLEQTIDDYIVSTGKPTTISDMLVIMCRIMKSIQS